MRPQVLDWFSLRGENALCCDARYAVETVAITNYGGAGPAAELEVLSLCHCSRRDLDHMNLRRGLLAGLSWGLVGLVGPPAVIAAFTLVYWWFCGIQAFDRRYDIVWWQDHAFPGIVVIPMLLFFAGLVTYAPKRHVGFAKNLAILAVTSLPLAALLGAMGMAHRRYKSIEHPPIYFSEVLMFLIPLTALSVLFIAARSGRPARVGSSTDESPRSAAPATEPTHPPEPAAGPVGKEESSPPAG
jgi:hypothetical protein